MIDICSELHQNFLEFAYESNSQRAFPDARDGLKPGQRACLWEMYTNGYTSDKPHVKSAKIDGGASAMWWPHGNQALYETFGRMSMPWVNNIPEVDWHGNNGNIVIGQALAADRYTEARLAKITEEGMFEGIKKKNVPMILNFSEDAEWPEVLPAIFPRLLVNGSQGIGLTIANTWIPMNFNEVSDVIINYLKNNEIDLERELIDFPCGCTIINQNELSVIHKTGKGRVVLRGTAEIDGNIIRITELPYQVYVEPFLDSIKELIVNEEITYIKNIYNKTDKKRLLIEIECTSSPSLVLGQLYDKTELQTTYSANQWALVGKTPKLLTLEDYIKIYTEHNIECIVKEYNYDLDKANSRIIIVNGLLKALEDIDNVIETIKSSKDSNDAISQLCKKYKIIEVQAKAIVDMKLGKLANLERIELQKEADELNKKIEEYNAVLSDKDKQKKILINKLTALVNKYKTPRKTRLENIDYSPAKTKKEVVEVEPEKVIVTLTADGAVKRTPAAAFKVHNRNSKGVKNQSDIIKATIRTNTVDSLLAFSNLGKVYKLPVSSIPVGTNQSIKTLVPMSSNEKACLIYSIYKDTEKKYIVFITKNGMIKKSSLSEYENIRKKTGTSAIKLQEGDELISVALADEESIILVSSLGKAIRFNLKDVSATGRASAGVRAMNLGEGDFIVAAMPVRDVTDQLAIFSENGLGKKINLTEIGVQGRGGKGIIIYKKENVVAATMINDEDNILINGTPNSLCISAKDIPVQGRTAAGNILIKGSKITSVSKV